MVVLTLLGRILSCTAKRGLRQICISVTINQYTKGSHLGLQIQGSMSTRSSTLTPPISGITIKVRILRTAGLTAAPSAYANPSRSLTRHLRLLVQNEWPRNKGLISLILRQPIWFGEMAVMFLSAPLKAYYFWWTWSAQSFASAETIQPEWMLRQPPCTP